MIFFFYCRFLTLQIQRLSAAVLLPSLALQSKKLKVEKTQKKVKLKVDLLG